MAAIALVGGAGFIGSRLGSDLQRIGHRVTVVDIEHPTTRELPFRHADVRSRSELRAALEGADVVFNLAAVHRDDVEPVSQYAEVNVCGARNLCSVCRELGIAWIVFTSSVAVYGGTIGWATEEDPTAPSNPYGRTKLLAEAVHREWQAEEPSIRTLVIVRPAVVFGEGNRGNVYHLIRQIDGGRFVMVGDGKNRKSMAYVGNLSEFLVHVLTLETGDHLFNYVDGPDMSMKELVEAILHASGSRRPTIGARIPYVVGYLGGLVFDLVASVTGRGLPVSAVRIKKFCSNSTFAAVRVRDSGFLANVSLQEALVRTIKYEVRNGPARG